MSIKENILNKSGSYSFYKEHYESLTKKYEELEKKIEEKNLEIKDKNKQIKSLTNQLKKKDDFIATQSKDLKRIRDAIINLRNNMFTKFRQEASISKEINYALIFNDTIRESDWLKRRNFSLNNAASNYSFMYTLFRVLDEVKPMKILELGLGQTSKMTTQYANAFSDSSLTIVEDDQIWIDNFSNNFVISDNIDIVQRDTEKFIYENTENFRYANLEEIVKDEKFDLVVIDGPLGYVMDPEPCELDYSRSNIWNLIDNLAEDFVIIMDDHDRQGEKNTIIHLEELLKERGITFYNFKSTGLKEQYVICSEKYRYVSWF